MRFSIFKRIILALGVRLNNELHEDLENEIDQLFSIGDARIVGKIANATHGAHILAANLE